ncbi:hypothetical protein QUC31_014380 [Theobroma cacao]
MASSMVSSAAVASVNRATPAQASMVAPFTGLNQPQPSQKKNSIECKCGLRLERRSLRLCLTSLISPEQLAKEVEYLLRRKWIPRLEFELQHGFVYRENHRSPGYYDGRYRTMWKLPMFGCTDATQVLKELEEAKKAYPKSFIRIIGFDNRRRVQCIIFIAYKPPGF